MQSWAIIVGINEYPPTAGLRVLHGAVADAVDFADWALDPRGGAVDPAHLFLWTSSAPMSVTAAMTAYLAAPTAYGRGECPTSIALQGLVIWYSLWLRVPVRRLAP